MYRIAYRNRINRVVDRDRSACALGRICNRGSGNRQHFCRFVLTEEQLAIGNHGLCTGVAGNRPLNVNVVRSGYCRSELPFLTRVAVDFHRLRRNADADGSRRRYILFAEYFNFINTKRIRSVPPVVVTVGNDKAEETNLTRNADRIIGYILFVAGIALNCRPVAVVRHNGRTLRLCFRKEVCLGEFRGIKHLKRKIICIKALILRCRCAACVRNLQAIRRSRFFDIENNPVRRIFTAPFCAVAAVKRKVSRLVIDCTCCGADTQNVRIAGKQYGFSRFFAVSDYRNNRRTGYARICYRCCRDSQCFCTFIRTDMQDIIPHLSKIICVPGNCPGNFLRYVAAAGHLCGKREARSALFKADLRGCYGNASNHAAALNQSAHCCFKLNAHLLDLIAAAVIACYHSFGFFECRFEYIKGSLRIAALRIRSFKFLAQLA